MTDTFDLYQRFRMRDPRLFAALYSGEPETVEAMTKILRLTPLQTLAHQQEALVDVLVALPELHQRLRRVWAAEDPVLTARLFLWAERTRTRLHRAA